jgi:hypothetical protein
MVDSKIRISHSLPVPRGQVNAWLDDAQIAGDHAE